MQKRASKALSFLVSATAVSILVGIVVYRSPRIRQEIESQLTELLEISRTTLDTAHKIVRKVRGITGIAGGKEEMHLAEKKAKALSAYDEEWESILL